MKTLTRNDVIAALGEVDDATAVEILDIGATADELAEARAWLVNDEPLMNVGRPLPAGRVGRLVELLESIGEEEPGPLGHQL